MGYDLGHLLDTQRYIWLLLRPRPIPPLRPSKSYRWWRWKGGWVDGWVGFPYYLSDDSPGSKKGIPHLGFDSSGLRTRACLSDMFSRILFYISSM